MGSKYVASIQYSSDTNFEKSVFLSQIPLITSVVMNLSQRTIGLRAFFKDWAELPQVYWYTHVPPSAPVNFVMLF